MGIAGLLCATVAMALPEGRRLRPEEYWRPAQGRDLSKYKPRQAVVPATEESLAWAIKEVKKTGASTKKGTNVDLKATCGIEGPARAGRIVGGHEAEEHEWPGRWLFSLTMLGSVVDLSLTRTMSSLPLTVSMELPTLTSWLELTT